MLKRRSAEPIAFDLAPTSNVLLFTIASSIDGAMHALDGASLSWFDCVPRGIRLIPAENRYRCEVQPFERFDYLVATIEPALIDECVSELRLPAARRKLSPLMSAKPVRTISMILDLIARDCQRGTLTSRMTRDAYARLLARSLLDAMPPFDGGAKLGPARIKRIREFIDERFAEDLAVSDLAAIAETSRWHFSRAFRNEVGLSPKRYLLKRRVDEAAALLLRTDMSIGEIANVTGFSTQSHLGSAFRQMRGMSPHEYRSKRVTV